MILKSFFPAVVCALLWSLAGFSADIPRQPSSSGILHKIEKLNVLGSVLYFAAHPDDENTGLIAYMAGEKKYETFYLSLTRGDGGQNLIGPEMRELLGIIRTQELLQARRTDGGKQYFSRANDFGYSKNPEETMKIWDREAVLADAVWIIRKTRPDVIITRFPPDARAGHGHHTASALLAREAFDAAGDPARFPEQLKYVQVWKPERLMWNISMWSVRNREEYVRKAGGYIKTDIGKYNPLLGASYGEIAARSRSMHKSQGFGATGTRGVDIEYFEHVAGRKAESDLFDGINTTWSRVKGAGAIPGLIAAIKKDFDAARPWAGVPGLLKLRKVVAALDDGYWKAIKLDEIDTIIKDALGLFSEVVAGEDRYTPGQPLEMQLEVINRSPFPVTLVSWSGPFGAGDTPAGKALEENEPVKLALTSAVPEALPFSQPYWLSRDIGYAGMFEVQDPLQIGLPENLPPAVVHLKFAIEGTALTYAVPVVFKKNDPVRGEVYEPLVISPPVYTALDKEVYMFSRPGSRAVAVTVTAAKDQCRGKVRLQVPPGWKSSPETAGFDIPGKGGNAVVTFEVTPGAAAGTGEMIAIAETGGAEYDRGLGVIGYDHIPRQVYFPRSAGRLVRLDLEVKGRHIGYIHGAGDAVPGALQEIGYRVSILEDRDIEPAALEGFDAVILGVRAFNTRPVLGRKMAALLEYVKGGGNLIVQYNTGTGPHLEDPGPYPFEISRERVSVEDAEVRILDPESPVLTSPNRITPADFDGWVQERGLYFPQDWDSRYKTVISSNDPGGAPLDGGILYTRYGKGYYVYTSLSWFRELPAGVPGAFRLFVNLISLGK